MLALKLGIQQYYKLVFQKGTGSPYCVNSVLNSQLARNATCRKLSL